MKPEFTGEGKNCPKCRKQMKRYKHKSRWVPKAKQPYYFRFWDKCKSCRHLQHYEEAKIFVRRGPDELERECRNILSQ